MKNIIIIKKPTSRACIILRRKEATDLKLGRLVSEQVQHCHLELPFCQVSLALHIESVKRLQNNRITTEMNVITCCIVQPLISGLPHPPTPPA